MGCRAMVLVSSDQMPQPRDLGPRCQMSHSFDLQWAGEPWSKMGRWVIVLAYSGHVGHGAGPWTWTWTSRHEPRILSVMAWWTMDLALVYTWSRLKFSHEPWIWALVGRNYAWSFITQLQASVQTMSIWLQLIFEAINLFFTCPRGPWPSKGS